MFSACLFMPKFIIECKHKASWIKKPYCKRLFSRLEGGFRMFGFNYKIPTFPSREYRYIYFKLGVLNFG